MPNYLHNHPEFKELLRAVDRQKKIEVSLVEKDYWIMHVLHGLQKGGFDFELKGGTSLSKGYSIIHRFSEDIDIRINPPAEMKVMTGRNHDKPQHCESRRQYYDWLAQHIKINGIEKVNRDTKFDNEKYMSGGIRLYCKDSYPLAGGLKEGVLLEVGFDEVTPNKPLTISSWALDFALEKGMDVTDNRAVQVRCYDPGYTFVEKLQTILTKFRKLQETGTMQENFARHYYDVACLLKNDAVQKFIGTENYGAHKAKRFPAADRKLPIREQEAFKLSDKRIKELIEKEYKITSTLYYQGQPPFEEILRTLSENIARL